MLHSLTGRADCPLYVKGKKKKLSAVLFKKLFPLGFFLLWKADSKMTLSASIHSLVKMFSVGTVLNLLIGFQEYSRNDEFSL
jgi:hypothetical protein